MILKNYGQGRGDDEYVADRPGHDRRYAIDATKIMALAAAKIHRINLNRGLKKQWSGI